MTSSAERGRTIAGQHRPRRFAIQATVELARSRTVTRARQGGVPRFVVLGNQKAGTSVIAAAIGEALGGRYQIDLPIERFDPTYRLHPVTGADYPEQLLRRSRHRLGAPVLKEPSLTFWWRDLAVRWPEAKIVFVVREPLDNIRSILDRLGLLSGAEGPSLPEHEGAVLPFPWLHLARLDDAPVADRRPVTNLDDMVTNLGRRWRLCAEAAAAGAEAGHLILRYEDFLLAPEKAVGGLGLPSPPTSVLRRSHQPRGANRDRDPADVLGPSGSRLWPDIAPLAERFGYSAVRKSAPHRRIPEPNNTPDLTPGTVRRDAPARPHSRTGPAGVVEPHDRSRSSGKGAWT